MPSTAMKSNMSAGSRRPRLANSTLAAEATRQSANPVHRTSAANSHSSIEVQRSPRRLALEDVMQNHRLLSPSQLRSDLDRFAFLLGANDGEPIFQPYPDRSSWQNTLRRPERAGARSGEVGGASFRTRHWLSNS